MKPEEMQSDEQLTQALDRLSTRVAPESATANDFAARVMDRIRGTEAEVRRPRPLDRWLVRVGVGAAACLVVSLVLRQAIVARHSPPATLASDNRPQLVTPARQPAVAAPTVRTSTWSIVTEGVVLEEDVPVRKLFYREFQQVEVLDSQGNSEGHLVVPTKAMLVAADEWY